MGGYPASPSTTRVTTESTRSAPGQLRPVVWRTTTIAEDLADDLFGGA